MKFVPLMRFRCMGFDPQEFEFGDDWAATLVVVKLKFFSFLSFIVLNCFNHLKFFFMKENHEDELNFQENLGHFENGLILWKHNRDAASVYNLDSVFECIE